ncbi:MAG: surface-adhesin E family protein, partial [Azonexus sp.]
MPARIIAVLLAVIAPATVSAAWTTVASEQGKRVEIDRSSIVNEQDATATAKGRVVLDRPIVDPKTSAAYRIIEIESRYDCTERTHATLKRTYYKEEGEILRQEDVRSPFEMPVRSGTPDDRLLREACRPKGTSGSGPSVNATLDKINEVAGDLRKSNEALVAQAVKKDLQRFNTRSTARTPGNAAAKLNSSGSSVTRTGKAQQNQDIDWSYEGRGNPDLWGRLRPEYAT